MCEIDIFNQKECEYFDKKVIHHIDKADMLHDILCLANSEAPCDRFLVFGIDDDGKSVGIEVDIGRRKSNQFMNWLEKIPFNKRPVIEFDTIKKNGLEFDVITIRNLRFKPYFLRENYKDKKSSKKTIVRAGVVYTRIGDTNTPIDKCSDDFALEKMFRERLYIEAPSIVRIEKYLADLSSWKYGYDEQERLFFYYEYFSEFTVLFSRKHKEHFDEPWVKHFPDRKASSDNVYLKYHGTVLYETVAVWCDGYRFLTIIPNIWSNSRDFSEDKVQVYLSYYFLTSSLEHLINKMIQGCYKISSEFYLPKFPVFDCIQEAKEKFDEDRQSNKKRFVYYYFDTESNQHRLLKDGRDMGFL